MKHPPTSIKNLEQLYDIAKKHLSHVYLGNVSDEKRSSTYCSNCGNLLIERNRYHTSPIEIDHRMEIAKPVRLHQESKFRYKIL